MAAFHRVEFTGPRPAMGWLGIVAADDRDAAIAAAAVAAAGEGVTIGPGTRVRVAPWDHAAFPNGDRADASR